MIIPTYNRKEYLRHAIESVLGQTFSDYEIIVVDDGSSDGTGEMLAAYKDRVHYIHQHNQGEAVARNTGLSYARGELVAFLDDDDIWFPQKLQRQVEVLQTSPQIGLVACQGYVIDEQGSIVHGRCAFHRHYSGYVSLEETVLNSPIAPSASVVRREVISDVGGFDPALRYGEDWDFALRVAAKYSVLFLNEPLLALRVQPGRQSDFLLNPEKASRRFLDHLRIAAKLTAILPAEQVGLLDRVLAKEYVEIGLNDLANGRFECGQRRLAAGTLMDSGTWLGGSSLEPLALAYAHAIASKYTAAAGAHFLSKVFDSLPVCRQFREARKRHSLAHFHADVAFISASRRDWPGVRMSVIRAVSYNPCLAQNRGLWSVFLGSLLGSESIASVRDRLRRTVKGKLLSDHCDAKSE